MQALLGDRQSLSTSLEADWKVLRALQSSVFARLQLGNEQLRDSVERLQAWARQALCP